MRAILTYHSLDDSRSPISVAPAAFEDHFAFLTSGAVRVMSLADLAVANPSESRPAVAVTFDDGFRNTAGAVARLADAGLPVTVFVVTSHAGGTNAWRGRGDVGVPVLPLLDWDELGALAARGVSLGGHTRTHPRLTEVSETELQDQVAGCRQDLLDRTGGLSPAFAYPYGDVDGRVRGAVAARFAAAVTTRFAQLGDDDDRSDLPRLDMYYFQRPGALSAFGRRTFGARVQRIALRRRVRAWFS